MAEFSINWQLQRNSNRHPKKNRYISSFKLNSKWNLVCLWSHNEPYKPEYLEICRSSIDKEVLVSGTFALLRGSECVLKRKIVQLIEANFSTTQVELEYPADCYKYYSYSITGTIKIPAVASGNEGVQFESLLDLSTNLECLLDSKSTYFSDVNFECGMDCFPVHKVILSARSPVFAAMFTTDMKENRCNVVKIKDLSPRVLKIMLNYIYSGNAGELSYESAGQLLFAADKYAIQCLKKLCSDYLKSCVSVQNVLHILVLGFLHENGLKDFAIDFICNSCGEFEVWEKTVEWKALCDEIPPLAIDVLTCLVKSKKIKEERLKTSKVFVS